MNNKNTLPVSSLVLCYAMLALFVSNASLTSIGAPFIVQDLGGDRTISIYPIAFFNFGIVITVPLAKPLFARLGLYRTLFLALFLFAITNILTGLMPTFFLVNLFRFLSGLGVGPSFALVNQAVYLLVPSEKRSLTSWIYSTVLISAPILGGIWGGLDAYLYHWQFPFFVDGVVGLFLMGWLTLRKGDLELPYHPDPRFDWVGWWFYAFSIFALTFICTTCQQLDYYRSETLLACFFLGVPTFLYFLLRCRVSSFPVYNLRLFSTPLFSLAAIALVLFFTIYYGTLLLLNIWITFDVQFTPNWIAGLLSIMFIAALFPHVIITDWIFRFDPRFLLLFSTLILTWVCFFTSTFWHEIDIGRIFYARLLAGIGFALSLPTIIQLLMRSLPEENRIDAQEFYQGLRHFASGLGAALFSVTWQRRSIFYHERLNEWLNLQNSNVQVFFQRMKIAKVPGDRFAELNTYLDNQSWTLALEDVFFLMGWIMVGLLLLILWTFLRPREKFDLREVQKKLDR
ncbi:MAG: MFS transporter [Verrucomicrobiota bacterium]|nr:MFS transporter [Verrucomicrobiota bacterium]